MKKLLLTLCALFSIGSINAQSWVNAVSIGAVQGTETTTYSVRDANGNLYVSSNFDGTRSFGAAGSQTSTGFFDVYIIKYNSAGGFEWFRKFGAVFAFTTAGGLALDASGNLYVAGTFTNQIVLNSVPYSSAGGRDLFLAKLDPNGNTIWGKTAGSSSNEESYSLSVTGSKIFLAGNYTATFTDGSVTIPSPGGNEDVLVASYNAANGTCLAMTRCGGSNSDAAFGVSASQQAIYVTGTFKGAANFGTFNLTSANTSGPNPTSTPDMFIMKLDSLLNITWAYKAGAGSTDQGNSVAQDAAGNAYVAGYFLGSVNFGNGVTLVEANGYGDGFLVKYNPSGTCQWGRKISSGVSDVATCVTTDPQGSCYVSGSFGVSATFSSTVTPTVSLISTGLTDAFVAKWGTNGQLRWAVKLGSSGDDRAQSVCWNNNGFCSVVANYAATLTVGSLGSFPTPGIGTFGQIVANYDGLTAGLNGVNSQVELNVYPNPSNIGSLTITAPANASVEYIAIFSIDGKLVLENNFIGGNEVQLNTAELAKGNYLLKVQTSKGSATQQVQIQ